MQRLEVSGAVRPVYASLGFKELNFFMFEFPCIISLYYIENQQDATLAACHGSG